MSEPVKRNALGHPLAGGPSLNPGGRPRGAIQEVRELLGPHAPEFVAALVALSRSENEATRLAAIREAFDRLLGKAPVAVDTTVAKFDLGATFLAAVQMANRPDHAIDITPADEPAEDATDQADVAW